MTIILEPSPPAVSRDPLELSDLVAALVELERAIRRERRELVASWRAELGPSADTRDARNLAAYIALRHHDIRAIQDQLACLGLSSLGRAEAEVLGGIEAVVNALRLLDGQRVPGRRIHHAATLLRRRTAILEEHTEQLLGPRPAGRRTRIMVTLPREAATDPSLAQILLERGMDCARINTAHDDPLAWAAMAANVRRAERRTGRRCRLLVDLPGPKLRIGPFEPAPGVVRLRAPRGPGATKRLPEPVLLDASGAPGHSARPAIDGREPARLRVDPAWLSRLEPADVIEFVDLRGRARELRVEQRLSSVTVLASCTRTARLGEGVVLTRRPRPEPGRDRGRGASAADTDAAEGSDPGRSTCTVGDVEAVPPDVWVRVGDPILLARDGIPGRAGSRHDGVTVPPRISCVHPGVLDGARPGDRVLIDDGHVETCVESLDEDGAVLRVTRTRLLRERLRADQGLNFPDARLEQRFAASDEEGLHFAVGHADIVGLSFVQSARDIVRIHDTLGRMGGDHLGVVAKIETRAGVEQLPEIMVAGARRRFGVMIARGDLAVEVGYERLAEIQEELLWLCEAARAPVIWATQVLEQLVKTGIPSRAEVTDAAMAERAECVMLNKGPYLVDAVTMLDDVIVRMEAHQRKKTSRLRALRSW